MNVLNAIGGFIAKHNYSPAVRELTGILNVKSTSTIQWYLNRLKEKGYIHSNSVSPRTNTILRKS